MPPTAAEIVHQQTTEHSWREWALRGLGTSAIAGLAVLSGCSPAPSEVSTQSEHTLVTPGEAVTEAGTTIFVHPDTASTSTSSVQLETTTLLATTTTATTETTLPSPVETTSPPEVVSQDIDKISVDQAAGLQLGLGAAAVGGRGYNTEHEMGCPDNYWRAIGSHGSFVISFNKRQEIDAIQFDSPAYSTLSGITIGSRPQDIDKAYGKNILDAQFNGDAGPYDVKIFHSPQGLEKDVEILFSLIDGGDGRGKVVKYITVVRVGGQPLDC